MSLIRVERWPFTIDGIVESVISTEQPNGNWSVAALGLRGNEDLRPGDPITARTWGNTRTKRNLVSTGMGYIHFEDDPVTFTEAALGRWERQEPILDAAAAWTRVAATEVERGSSNEVDWIDWELMPEVSAIKQQSIPRLNRGFAAIVEMTVAASRLTVPGFDEDRLRCQLEALAGVVRRCGGSRERTALDRIEALTAWEQEAEPDVQ